MTKNERRAYDKGFTDAMRAFSYFEGRTIKVGGPMSARPLDDVLKNRVYLVHYKPAFPVSATDNALSESSDG